MTFIVEFGSLFIFFCAYSKFTVIMVSRALMANQQLPWNEMFDMRRIQTKSKAHLMDELNILQKKSRWKVNAYFRWHLWDSQLHTLYCWSYLCAKGIKYLVIGIWITSKLKIWKWHVFYIHCRHEMLHVSLCIGIVGRQQSCLHALPNCN